MLAVLHGGDGRLADQMSQLISVTKEATDEGVFKGQSIAYVAAGLEPLIDRGDLSRQAVHNVIETVIQPAFQREDATSVRLIWAADIEAIFNVPVVILSGGETAYLLSVLQRARMADRLTSGQHSIDILMGISAGAIALAEAGIGTEAGKVSRFTGMGIVKECVCPHAETHPERHEIAKDATPLGAFAVARFVELPQISELKA